MPPLLLRAFAALAVVFSAHAQVVINEINYDPADPTKALEFVELFNAGATAVNLSGWRMENAVDFVFPNGTSIAPGGYVVVAENPAVFQARYGFAPLGPWTGSLSNDGERVQIRNAAAAVVDQVNYGIGFPWPTAAKGAGGTLERIHPGLEADLGGNWRASAPVLIARGATGWHWRAGSSEASAPTNAWTAAAFVENGTWTTAATALPIGYGEPDILTPISGMQNVYRSVYLRKTFTLPAGPLPNGLVLRVRVDDGAVCWINGTELSPRIRATGTPNFNATGMTIDNAIEPVPFVDIPISNAGSILQAGTNVLAIQGFNTTLNSSDFLVNAELIVEGGTPGAQNNSFSATAPPAIRQVTHAPNEPAAGVPVLISARITDPQGVATVTLGYQLVDPGSYIRRTDAAYATTWTNVPMVDDGTGGDLVAGDGIFSATMPAALQTNRRLIRYRLTATDTGAASITVPYADDEQPNFAYFVYNGVPDWSGAVLPGGTGSRATVKTYPGTLLNGIQVWQIIANNADVDNSQYVSASNGVRFYCTVVYDGKVYDHIAFHNRGIGSTYVSGKNKWALNFNRARDVRVKNNWGNYYNESWNSFPIDACAAPWAAVHRGMAGVEEAMAYRLYELAGMSSLRTHYMHLRVIDDALEFGATQYVGDFWGLYMGLEPTEGNFINERKLPDGNVYAIEGAAGDKKTQSSTQPLDTSDWNAFRDAAVLAGQNEAWYRANMDLNAFYTFFALNRFCGNVDVRPGDNYRYYHRSSDNRWVVIPYDLDMMSLPAHHWGGTLADGVVWAGATSQSVLLSRHTALAIEFRNRCREMLSLLASDGAANGGQIGQLVDEYAQLVKPTGAPFTWADADEAMWCNHPRTVGTGANSGQTSHKNNFYRAIFADTRGGLAGTPATNWTRTHSDPDGDGYVGFQDKMDYLVNFMTNTWPGGAWTRSNGLPAGYGYQHLLWESLYGGWGNVNANPTVADLAFPNPPTIAYAGPNGFPANALDFTSSAFSPATVANGGTAFTAMQWRVGEIYAPGIPGYVAGTKRRYEVENVWTSAELPAFTATTRFPQTNIEPGKTYRARVRHKDANGRWSQWSAPVQFVAGTPDVAVYVASLVVSEVNYNPAPVTPAEFAAGFSSDDFEWVELKNISAQPVTMADVRFTKGIDFDFPAAWTIPPGGFALVVRNLAAFQLRWGHAFDAIIAGVTADNFSNGSEEVKLSYGAGTEIFRFVYQDIAPWPAAADGTGHTLVLRTPAPLASATDGTLWRASYGVGGSPGADDVLTFEAWRTDYPGVLIATDDSDGDGLFNLVEYALAANPLAPSPAALPASGIVNLTVAGTPDDYFVLTFTHRTDASDLTIEAQFATAVPGPWSASGVLVSATPNANNTVTEMWRSPLPRSAYPELFGRVWVSKP